MGVCSPCYWNFRLCFAIVIFLAGPPSPFRSFSLSCLPLAVALLSASVMLRPSRLSWFGYPFSHSSSVSYLFSNPLLLYESSLSRVSFSLSSFSCSFYSFSTNLSLSYFLFLLRLPSFATLLCLSLLLPFSVRRISLINFI